MTPLDSTAWDPMSRDFPRAIARSIVHDPIVGPGCDPTGMRGSATGDVGETGEKAASLAFQKIGWPCVQTSKQELGTDLWVEARDRRFDRGLLLGAQVKSGSSWFKEDRSGADGAVDGWWFRDTLDHFDYWLGHALPHVIVLHDTATDICYWEHLTSAKVERTPKGGKVVVPMNQTIASDGLAALRVVAASANPDVPLEGTVWAGGHPVSVADHLRFALVTPRLIAPHPNRGAGPRTAAEAVALIAQTRSDHVWPYGSPHGGVPSRANARTHRDWVWRFAVAFADWMTTEDPTGISALLADAPTTVERVAATVVVAHT